MSNHEPTAPYVYQPLGSVTHPKHAEAGRLWGVSGFNTVSPLIEGTLRGLTRAEAEAVVRALVPCSADKGSA
jgi:hypothetical protein